MTIYKLVMVLAWLNAGTGVWDAWKEYPEFSHWPASLDFPSGRPIHNREDYLALSEFKEREFRADGAKVMYVDCIRINHTVFFYYCPSQGYNCYVPDSIHQLTLDRLNIT